MRHLRYALIWFLDWVVDVRILRHSSPRFCLWVAEHPWWESGAARPQRAGRGRP